MTAFFSAIKHQMVEEMQTSLSEFDGLLAEFTQEVEKHICQEIARHMKRRKDV